jgi:hypothetical protein
LQTFLSGLAGNALPKHTDFKIKFISGLLVQNRVSEKPIQANFTKEARVKELLRKIDAEYGFKLTEAEMDRIMTEVHEGEPLFRQLNAIDVNGKTPYVRLDVKRAKK